MREEDTEKLKKVLQKRLDEAEEYRKDDFISIVVFAPLLAEEFRDFLNKQGIQASVSKGASDAKADEVSIKYDRANVSMEELVKEFGKSVSDESLEEFREKEVFED